MEGHGKSWNLMEGSVSVTKYDLEVSQNFLKPLTLVEISSVLDVYKGPEVPL